MGNIRPFTNRARRVFTCTQRVAATPEQIFPLLCPVREYDWIPGWDCRVIYTESGIAEPGCVFQTDREADGGLDTWVISRHEPASRIAFVRSNPLRTVQYDIELEPQDNGTTLLCWTQVITALNEPGDRLVQGLDEADFAANIDKMETLLNDYLAA